MGTAGSFIDVLIEAWQILNELTAPILGAVYVKNGVYYTYLPTFEPQILRLYKFCPQNVPFNVN